MEAVDCTRTAADGDWIRVGEDGSTIQQGKGGRGVHWGTTDDDSSGEESTSDSDDDSITSCRSASATTTGYASSDLAASGERTSNIFSLLEKEPLLGWLEGDEDGSEGEDGDDGENGKDDKASTIPGRSGTSSPEREGFSHPAVGLHPRPLTLLREQLCLLPSSRVVAEGGRMADHASTVRRVLERVAGIVALDTRYNATTISTSVLTALVEAVRKFETELARASPRVDVARAPRKTPSSRVGDQQQSQTGEVCEQGAGERSPLPLSGHATGASVLGPHTPTDSIGATIRSNVGNFIGGLRSRLLGRHPKRTSKSASPSPAAPTVDEQHEVDVPALVEEITDGKDEGTTGRRAHRLRRRAAARTTLSQKSAVLEGTAVPDMPSKQFHIPSKHLNRLSQQAIGPKTRKEAAATILAEEGRRRRSRAEWIEAGIGSRVGPSARRCLGEIYSGIAVVLGEAESTVDLGGEREAPRYTTLKLGVRVADRKARAMVDTGAEVSCVNGAFVHRHWHLLGEYFSKDCPLGLRAADGDALQLEGMLHVPLRVGSKCYRQALFVVTNLKDEVLLGLDFLTHSRAIIDVAQQQFTFGSVDCRETVNLRDDADLIVGAIGTGENTYLVRADETKTVQPGEAQHLRVILDPPAPPDLYEFTNRHLLEDRDGALWYDGLLRVPQAGGTHHE